ncbi:MAG: radical SAM protein [Acidobacteriota bacterium]
MNRQLVKRAQERLRAEVGAVHKAHAGKLRIALAYPNTYCVGMSNLGFQAVYRFWNDFPDVVCERVFLPDRRELAELRRRRTPLFSLESQIPVRDFDVLAFSVTFEPDELNLIRMLDLAGIPALAAHRDESQPLVVAGGPIAFLNPEPLAPFLDVIAVGEAEALLPPFTEALRSEESRSALLKGLEEAGGFYLPSHYELRYRTDGTIADRHNKVGAENGIVRAKMGKGGGLSPPATYILTRATEMSRKFLVEVSRGCPTLCRFCWAGYNYLPKRSFEVERILQVAKRARAHTSEIGLVSTAVGAHPEIVPLVHALKELGFRVSVSSLRFEDLREELLDPLVASGERTLAVAPEVGTDRLRYAIHKRVPNRDILDKTDMIFALGVENLKLYLMVGLPGEREEDVEGIVDLVQGVRERMMAHALRRGRVGRLIPSINPFIPKPGTPFQWCAMAPQRELAGKMRFLQKALGRLPNVEAHCKSPRQEMLQAVLSLGDRRLAPAMLAMARGEANLKGALALAGLDLDFYIRRHRPLEEILPWGHIDNGMKAELLQTQYHKAQVSRSPEPEPAGVGSR